MSTCKITFFSSPGPYRGRSKKRIGLAAGGAATRMPQFGGGRVRGGRGPEPGEHLALALPAERGGQRVPGGAVPSDLGEIERLVDDHGDTRVLRIGQIAQ